MSPSWCKLCTLQSALHTLLSSAFMPMDGTPGYQLLILWHRSSDAYWHSGAQTCSMCIMSTTAAPCVQQLQHVYNICSTYTASAACLQHLHHGYNICSMSSSGYFWCLRTGWQHRRRSSKPCRRSRLSRRPSSMLPSSLSRYACHCVTIH